MDPYRYCSIRFSNLPLRFLVSQELPKYWVGERVSWHYGTTKKSKVAWRRKSAWKISYFMSFYFTSFSSTSLRLSISPWVAYTRDETQLKRCVFLRSKVVQTTTIEVESLTDFLLLLLLLLWACLQTARRQGGILSYAVYVRSDKTHIASPCPKFTK